MKRQYRIYGMSVCLGILLVSLVLLMLTDDPQFQDLAVFLAMFAGG